MLLAKKFFEFHSWVQKCHFGNFSFLWKWLPFNLALGEKENHHHWLRDDYYCWTVINLKLYHPKIQKWYRHICDLKHEFEFQYSFIEGIINLKQSVNNSSILNILSTIKKGQHWAYSNFHGAQFFCKSSQGWNAKSEFRVYSCVHISSDSLFSKILKKPSIVQKKIPHIKGLLLLHSDPF